MADVTDYRKNALKLVALDRSLAGTIVAAARSHTMGKKVTTGRMKLIVYAAEVETALNETKAKAT